MEDVKLRYMSKVVYYYRDAARELRPTASVLKPDKTRR